MTEPASTEGAGRILATAREEAERLGHAQIGTEHLLLALLREREALSADSAALLPKDADNAAKRLMGAGKRGAPPEEGLALSSRARRIMDEAAAEAGRQGRTAITPDHLLAALQGETKGIAAAILREASGRKKGDRAERPPAPAEAMAAPAVEPPDAQPRRERPKPREAEPPRKQESPPPPPKADRQDRPERGRGREKRGAPPVEPARGDRREARRDGRGAEAVPSALREPSAPPKSAEPPAPRRVAPVVGDPFRIRLRHLLLAAVPAALWLARQESEPVVLFVVACLAILPLSQYLGEATEHLAERAGPAVGGFLNATFGNAAELIIAIIALRAGMVELVKASIIGSILGNLLLILGLALMAAGINRKLFAFNRTATAMAGSMLLLAVAALVFPALFHSTHPNAAELVELHLSEAVAIVLGAVYLLSLLFSLITHRRLLGGDPHPTIHPVWGVFRALAVLTVSTVGIAVISEILVHAIGPMTEGGLLSEAFLGLIVIPVIGNAAEHASAVSVARKGKVDLALQIALGSSTQVALFVAPLLVGVGVLLGVQMDLVFSPFEVLSLALAAGVSALVTLDGESHWFEGVQLLALYGLVAIAAYFI
ncbi:MAG TPA: calcium/proton exchanger [Gemmatimonadales bacterium]|nr:calcium/proton exchanger [Gemmatimonadales bacterium]